MSADCLRPELCKAVQVPAVRSEAVTKQRPLAPAGYVPADLVAPNVRLAIRHEAALLNGRTVVAGEATFAAAAHDGMTMTMTLASGYRSLVTQAATYDGHVAALGQFIMRYPTGAHAITGYFYEPWHLRFIGI
ncbi:D-alanyl-D-alanine carboxypeptidase family protein [Arthrobacter sp. AK04]|uniref:D-alanyl-D-alanine carboxypeptidase family protein n=1 Tax=Arthrobacter sp. AK04 TaxID=2900048 RepID=UPI001E30A0F1|nr:D-alanyl-D-alanine carboxypeptidase family protein [Arthrobacter sp. AK04]MCD5341506.1 D-alanyl-D-alanine carboxypeptidase family protein [Arthrobacter sp. AK04]